MHVGFDKMKAMLAGRPGVYNPGGLAKAIGDKKYGKAGMAAKAAAGRAKKRTARSMMKSGKSA